MLQQGGVVPKGVYCFRVHAEQLASNHHTYADRYQDKSPFLTLTVSQQDPVTEATYLDYDEELDALIFEVYYRLESDEGRSAYSGQIEV